MEEKKEKEILDVSALTGKQKAAILLVSIGSEISSKVFKYLSQEEIESLTFEIAKLETITSELKDNVLLEFKELMMAQEFIQKGGIDYARELLEKSLGTQKQLTLLIIWGLLYSLDLLNL